MTTIAKTAKQEIEEFLQTNTPGVESSFTRQTLINAATSMFTANGQMCPVHIVERDGKAYLINRAHMSTVRANGNN